MKKLLGLFCGGIILGSVMLSGCLNEPMSTEHTGKDDKFQIEFLFEKDGLRMYRFYDGGNYHYFTTRGETITEQQSGKTYWEERIETKD